MSDASNLDEERTGIVWVPNYLAARRYRLVRRVGSGGMADVWLAHDTTLDREVALKRVPSQVGYDARGLADLKREATTAMALTHEYIVRIHNLESDGREYFLDMEYVSGGSVADRLARLGRLDPDEVTQLGIRLCEALAYAHRQGVVHRDIKPGNILLTESGEPKLADFGIAYALAATMRRVSNLAGVGTVAYMAPEQIRGQPPSHQTDLYQLGVTLYQCVSGRVPFEDGYVPGQILEAEPPPLEGVPSTLAAAIGRSLVKDPAQRPDGATELAKLLAGRAPVAETERPPAGASGSPPVRERPTPAGLPAGATMSPEGSTSPADASGDVNHAVSPGRELQEYAEPTKPRPGEADASEKRRRWVVGVVILAGVLILVAMAATAIIMNQAGTGPGSDGGDRVVVNKPDPYVPKTVDPPTPIKAPDSPRPVVSKPDSPVEAPPPVTPSPPVEEGFRPVAPRPSGPVMLGRLDVSHFAGLRPGDTPAQVASHYGRPTGDRGSSKTYIGWLTVDYENGGVKSVHLLKRGWNLVDVRVGLDDVVNMFAYDEARVIKRLGEPQQRESSGDGYLLSWTFELPKRPAARLTLEFPGQRLLVERIHMAW